MPDYDILWGTGADDEFQAYTDWQSLFEGEGWAGQGGFEGDYDSTEMHEYLEDNPWLQWGVEGTDDMTAQEVWESEGFELSPTDQPAYWMYEDIAGDDPYADLEDILQDIYGADVQESIYDEIFGDLEYGTSGGIYSQYMDEFFDFDPETGEFKSLYDPVEYEMSERKKFQLGSQKISSDLEASLGKFRGSEAGRGLGDIDLDISDIAEMAEGQSGSLAEDYRLGVYQSESAYLDDLMEAIATMSGESTIFLDEGGS